MLMAFKRGQTGVILRVKIRDSSTGNGKTSLTYSTTGLTISTIADNEASPTYYTGANVEDVGTVGTYAAPSSGACRFREVHSSHPGVYEIQLENARYAVSNAKSLLVSVTGVAGALDCDAVVPLWDFDPYSAAPDVNVATWRGSTPNALVSNRVDARVGAMGVGVSIITDGIGGTAISSAAQTVIFNKVTAGLDAYQLQYLAAFDGGAAPPVDGSYLSRLAGKGVTPSWTTYDNTTDSLEAIRDLTAAVPTAAENATAVLTTQMAESYAADGVAPTLAQAAFLILQRVIEVSASGTTITIKKLDKTTTAATLTTNDPDNPTSTTRAT